MANVTGRTFRFSTKVWDALDKDAERCHRSSVKQLEAILTSYYGLGDVEINEGELEIVGELLSKGKAKIPVIEATVETSSKKKRSA